MSSPNAIISFECTKPSHREALSRRGVGGLTIHEGAWAYCDAMTADQDHDWSATGGVPQADLVRWSKRASGSIAAQLVFGASAAVPGGRPAPAPRPLQSPRPAAGSAEPAAGRGQTADGARAPLAEALATRRRRP